VTNQAGTAKTIDTTRGGSPSNGHVAISADGTQAKLNASDASTQLTVTYIAFPGVGSAVKSIYDRLETSQQLGEP